MSTLVPRFRDCCEHGVAYFVRRVTLRDHSSADLYVYPSTLGAQLCFRYGDEPREYVSPGSVASYLLRGTEFLDDDVRRALSDLYQVGRLQMPALIKPRCDHE